MDLLDTRVLMEWIPGHVIIKGPVTARSAKGRERLGERKD